METFAQPHASLEVVDSLLSLSQQGNSFQYISSQELLQQLEQPQLAHHQNSASVNLYASYNQAMPSFYPFYPSYPAYSSYTHLPPQPDLPVDPNVSTNANGKRRRVVEPESQGRRNRKNSKKLKHKPKGPKNPRSSYVFYVAEQRRLMAKTEIMSKMSFTEVAVLVGKKWRALAEAERKPYEDKSREDRERYIREHIELDSSQ